MAELIENVEITPGELKVDGQPFPFVIAREGVTVEPASLDEDWSYLTVRLVVNGTVTVSTKEAVGNA